MPTDFKIPFFLLASINEALEKELTWLVVNVSYQMIDKEDVRFFKTEAAAQKYYQSRADTGEAFRTLHISSPNDFLQQLSGNKKIDNAQEMDVNKISEDPLQLLSQAVLDKAKIAFEHHENWVAYNNTLLFVHEDDIQFFGSEDAALDFAEAGNDEGNFIKVERFGSVKELTGNVESDFQIINHNKKQVMDQENLDYLGKQQFYLGFDEGLKGQLEEKLKEGLPEFQIPASHTFGKDDMEAVLNYKRSEQDGSERYFLNSYVATLKKESGDLSQFIYVNNKGKSITFKESCNLLNGRSVFKELHPKNKEPYYAWVKIDHEKIDEKTGYPKLRPFGEGYGFDLHEAVGRMAFKELGDPDKLQTLYASLEKGNAAPATLLKGGKEMNVTVAADPEFHTLKMWDAGGVKMFVPNKKVEEKYGQAPADELRQQGLLGNGDAQAGGQAEAPVNGVPKEGIKQDGVQADGVKQEKKVDLMPKKVNNHLLEKKRTRKQGQGQAIS